MLWRREKTELPLDRGSPAEPFLGPNYRRDWRVTGEHGHLPSPRFRAQPEEHRLTHLSPPPLMKNCISLSSLSTAGAASMSCSDFGKPPQEAVARDLPPFPTPSQQTSFNFLWCHHHEPFYFLVSFKCHKLVSILSWKSREHVFERKA